MELKRKKINKFVTIEYNDERVIITNGKIDLNEVQLKLDTFNKIKKVLDSNRKTRKKNGKGR